MLSAALAALVSVAAGAPTESIEARSLPAGAFQIKQVDNGQQYINGQLEMMKTYNKFADAGAVAPESVRSGAQKAAKQQGSVKATPEQFDQAYVSPVTLGSSLVMLDFDTGSADLWAFSNEQPAAQRKGQYVHCQVKNPLPSKAYVNLNALLYQRFLQYGVRQRVARLLLEHRVWRRVGSEWQCVCGQGCGRRSHRYPPGC